MDDGPVRPGGCPEGVRLHNHQEYSSQHRFLDFTQYKLSTLSSLHRETFPQTRDHIMSLKYAKDQPAGFNNHVEKVAIVGAGGTIGSYFTKYLLATGKHTITALVRARSKVPLADGVHRVEIDYNNTTTLVDALKGQDILIITLGAMSRLDPLQPERKLVEAAAQAGVPYVMPNAYGPDPLNPTLMREMMLDGPLANGRAIAEDLGVSQWLVLACGFWYEWSLVGNGKNRFGIDFDERTVTLFDEGEEKITTATFEQCGRAVAALLSLKKLPEDAVDAEKNKDSTIAHWASKKAVYISSFRVNQKDMFESAKRVTGTTDADWKVERVGAREHWEQAVEALKQGTDREAFSRALYTRIFFPTGEGDHTKLELANAALGLPEEDLDEQTEEGIRLGKTGVLTYH
ncbi:putative oxidoreductase CipA [Coniella lustricola]|uniref:Putative oxidoreductase CipA n=1 Tax=Coniella lustricola TaxID=2025994 RepID=A0A2T3AFW7_9PEZI|nr:putative oxidoreductase CipA [Coniella lustricola]